PGEPERTIWKPNSLHPHLYRVRRHGNRVCLYLWTASPSPRRERGAAHALSHVRHRDGHSPGLDWGPVSRTGPASFTARGTGGSHAQADLPSADAARGGLGRGGDTSARARPRSHQRQSYRRLGPGDLYVWVLVVDGYSLDHLGRAKLGRNRPERGPDTR